MGFLKKLFSGVKNSDKKENSSKKENVNSTDALYVGKEEKQINYDITQDSSSFLTDHCELIIENARQLEELKVEYQAVTSYLTDMQKVDRIPPEEREELDNVARQIITLTRERAKYQNATKNITDIQFKHIARYEDVITSELQKMENNETYNATIKNDMRYLEGEKGSLHFQREETIQNQNYLRKIAIGACVLVSLLFLLFLIVDSAFDTNTQIPFIMTILMGLVSAVYIFMNAGSNKRDIKIIESKLNRAIYLLNKVKIKLINNTNELEYSYQKYMVNSSAELNYLWEQYQKAKEEEKHYQKNSDELEYYNKELIRTLRSYKIVDADIWIYQAIAIIDNNEMVEVRHRLNVRRQKLRERIDYNNSMKERSIDAIRKYIEKSPESKGEVIEIIRRFGIEL